MKFRLPWNLIEFENQMPIFLKIKLSGVSKKVIEFRESCALFLEVGTCPKSVSEGFGTAAEDFSAISDLRKHRWNLLHSIDNLILKHGYEQGNCYYLSLLSDPHIGCRNFFGANLTQTITGMWQCGPRNIATFESGLRQKIELCKGQLAQ